MYPESLSEVAAEQLIDFLRETEANYVVHLPYDRHKPYYRPAAYGGFLQKTPEDAVGGKSKEHISDKKLVQTLTDAEAITVRPANETPQSVWGTIPPEESEIK